VAKQVRGWSKPDHVRELIGRKQVDASVFCYGSPVPQAFWDDFSKANGGYSLATGESKPLKIVFEGREFDARLVLAQPSDSTKGELQLRYDQDLDLLNLLRQRLAFSYEYLHVGAGRSEEELSANLQDVPPDCREFLEFYQTGTPFRYRLRIVQARTLYLGFAPAPPTSFDELWRMWGEETPGWGSTVVLVNGKGISITDRGEMQVIPLSAIEAVWNELHAKGILPVEAFPDVAKPYADGLAVALSGLPFVGNTRTPQPAIFLTSYVSNIDEVYKTFGLKPYSGICFGSSAQAPRLVLFTTSDPASKIDHPYTDYWEGDTFFYCGEGQRGDMTMTRGNRALQVSQEQDFPVFGFLKGDRTYSYMVQFKVLGVIERQQPDSDGQMRKAYVFRMKRVPAPLLPLDGLPIKSLDGTPKHSDTPTSEPVNVTFRVTLPTTIRWENCLSTGTLPLGQFDESTISTVRKRDRIMITRGQNAILAIGEVLEDATWPNSVLVTWDTSVAKRVPPQREWLLQAVAQLDKAEAERLLSLPGAGLPVNMALPLIVSSFANALRESRIEFGANHDNFVRAFLTALATKRFSILTGLSGSGKTQIALRLGEWFGDGHSLVVPVRPDWTGPESLFGYPDALKKSDGNRPAWYVAEALAFMLRAARDPNHPYLLVLDEMNLAHVERYFADFLSGMESGQPCLPNLQANADGLWRVSADGPSLIAMPDNLFVVGTVNVDETTYMFSPKVLDRANTFEFRVESKDLQPKIRKPLPMVPGDPALVRGFLWFATDEEWQERSEAPYLAVLVEHLKTVHDILTWSGFEFGHRVMYEAVRYASLLTTAGEVREEVALDQQVMQKILPRLHGNRKRLEATLCGLAQFCFSLTAPAGLEEALRNNIDFNVTDARLKTSAGKVLRMLRNLRTNQFAGFTE
jgi:MoxR-like ATPase